MMTNENINVRSRYFFSVVVDAIIHSLPFVPLGLLVSLNSSNVVWTLLLAFPLAALYLTSDWLFRGASIGKRIFKLRIESREQDGRPTLDEIITRRLIEQLVLLKIFLPKGDFDIDGKTNTRILRSIPASASPASSAGPSRPVLKSIIPLRVKAGVIDFLWIAPLSMASILLNVPEIQAIVDVDSTLDTLVSVVSTNLIILYSLTKDFLFGNQSYGKRRAGIEIVMSSGKRPSGRMILIRSIIQNSLWPIEYFMLFLSKRLIAEGLTDTMIRLVVKPKNPQAMKRKVSKR